MVRTFMSNIDVSKNSSVVMQQRCRQHRFSIGSGMFWHFVQMHQGTLLLCWAGSGGGVSCGVGSFPRIDLANWRPALEQYASQINCWHCSKLSWAVNSWKSTLYIAHNVFIHLDFLQPAGSGTGSTRNSNRLWWLNGKILKYNNSKW